LTHEYAGLWDQVLEVIRGNTEAAEQKLQKDIEQALASAESALKRSEKRNGKKGVEIWSLCPFHNDHNVGSFSLNAATGQYYCFVCGASGGLHSLLRKLYGDDSKALEVLQGIDPDLLTAALAKAGGGDEPETDFMPPLPRHLLHYFPRLPKKYLERGHAESTLRKMNVGYDEHFHRIVFPVISAADELVGIQTRAQFDDDLRWKWYRKELEYYLTQEYMEEELPEYRPPRKKAFYNENNAFPFLLNHDNSSVVMVEGMGHALRALSAGVVPMASFGTQLGQVQLRRLKGLRRKCGRQLDITLAYDGDDAGVMAAMTIAAQLGSTARTRIALLPEGSDPEDLTAGELRRVLREAQPYKEIAHSPGRYGDIARKAHAEWVMDQVKKARYRRKVAQARKKDLSVFGARALLETVHKTGDVPEHSGYDVLRPNRSTSPGWEGVLRVIRAKKQQFGEDGKGDGT
jgi:hypothetical protein